MKIYTNKYGQFVGKLSDEGIYRKIVDSKKHKMKMYNGYAIDREIYEDLQKLDCKEIRIKEEDTGIIYTSKFTDWVQKGILMMFDGAQICLPGKYLIVKN